MSSEIIPHAWVPEPPLLFDPTKPNSRDVHPLRGLLKYGPFSKDVMPDPIRVATIVPSGEGKPLYEFMRELEQPAKPTERRDYLLDWEGFQRTFAVRMSAAPKPCHLELDAGLEGEIAQGASPHIPLAQHLTRAIQRLDANRSDFDVLFVYLPQRWMPAFTGGDGDDFDLHDHLKAITARLSMPIQLVREDRALAYSDRASVMWRIGLALYVKAGGIPWKLADTEPDVAHIGISYALRPPTSEQARFVTCCSQVFDSDGSGLEFIAYDAREATLQRDNPFLSRNEMFRVMSRSLDLYRRRHAGKTPRRVFVHKTSEFKPQEIDGAMEALHLCKEVDLLQIVEHVGWQGVRLDRSKEPARYPVGRGTYVGLGDREALLWTHGDVRDISSRGGYFQGGKSTPRPIRLVRHAGHGPWDESIRSILALSKMDWNNDALYGSLPATLGYAKVLARVIKRMPVLGATPYQFRFFM